MVIPKTENTTEEIQTMTSKRIKQEQIKVTLPAELHAQLVARNLQEEGEVNLSSYIRKLIRIHLK